MTDDELADRLVKVSIQVAKYPKKYKVCCCCNKILYKTRKICECGGYRFSEDNVQETLDEHIKDFDKLKKLIKEIRYENTNN